jgi:chemotaxis protein methyltransferase CheR
MRWAGFRKVRGQVCKRVQRRLQALGLQDVHDYRERLEQDPGEWRVLDGFCRISISRFYRDRQVFDALARLVFPALVQLARARSENRVRCWSVGAAAGEEAYSLVLVWKFAVSSRDPAMDLTVHGTEVDGHQIARAQAACYGPGSLKELPEAWRLEAFVEEGDVFQLRPRYREPVVFSCGDLREEAPKDKYHLVLCRNLAFTYFDERLQRRVFNRLREHTIPGGALVIGTHEKLPPRVCGFTPWSEPLGIYRRVPPQTSD